MLESSHPGEDHHAGKPVFGGADHHGFDASLTDMAEIGDGTTNDYAPDAVSVLFANHLAADVPTRTAVHSCQQYVGDPPSGLCGSSKALSR